MPTPPRPTSSTGPRVGVRLKALERRIGGQARAHQRAGERRRQRRVIDQIARMRHQHMRGEAAVGGDAEMAVGVAEIFLAGLAGRASAAADPGIDRDPRAGLRARRLRPHALDHARDLVAERERQRAARRARRGWCLRRARNSRPACAGRNGRRRSARCEPAPRCPWAPGNRRWFRRAGLDRR